MEVGYHVLGVGNPFCDRSDFVEEGIVEGYGFTKGSTALTYDRADIDTSWEGDSEEFSLGGSCTNVMKTLTHLGHKCAVLGRIGIDDIGRKVKDRLAEVGINTSLLVDGRNPQGVVNCYVTPDKERTMHCYLGASVEFSYENITSTPFVGVKHVHLEGYVSYFPEVVATSVRHAKQNEAKVSFDLASLDVVRTFRAQLEEEVPKFDVVFGNEQEMKEFTGCDTAVEAAAHFDAHQTVVVTMGERGCIVKQEGEEDGRSYEAIRTPNVKDTTGAGDFFTAGFLDGTLGEEPIEKRVRKGSLAASYVICHIGADLPKDQWIELESRIQKV